MFDVLETAVFLYFVGLVSLCVVVCWVRDDVPRLVCFIAVSATAPVNTGTTKHAAKKSFRPFIPSSGKYGSKIFQNWASIFFSKR